MDVLALKPVGVGGAGEKGFDRGAGFVLVVVHLCGVDAVEGECQRGYFVEGRCADGLRPITRLHIIVSF